MHFSMNNGTPDCGDRMQRFNVNRNGRCWWEFSRDDNGELFDCDEDEGVDVIVALNEGSGGEEIEAMVVAGERDFSSFF